MREYSSLPSICCLAYSFPSMFSLRNCCANAFYFPLMQWSDLDKHQLQDQFYRKHLHIYHSDLFEYLKVLSLISYWRSSVVLEFVNSE